MTLASYSPLFSVIVSAVLTWLSLRALLSLNLGRHVQDIPNQRSLHHVPIPRIGGIAMLFGSLTTCVIDGASWWLMLPVVLLAGMSFLDDLRNLSVLHRLLVQLLAVAIMMYGYGLLQHGWILSIFLLLAVIWMTNLFNFMDGSDGLAGGMAMIGFATYGVAAWIQGADVLANVCFAVAGASLAFLYFNFHPAKVFMGDAGSIPLGFLAGVLALWGWHLNNWPWWFPILVFSPFIVDATLTLIRRLLRGEIPWQAHRDHYYQRLVRMGWGHRRTALAEYGVMLAAALTALLSLKFHFYFQVLVLFAWFAIYAFMAVRIDRRWREHIASSGMQ